MRVFQRDAPVGGKLAVQWKSFPTTQLETRGIYSGGFVSEAAYIDPVLHRALIWGAAQGVLRYS